MTVKNIFHFCLESLFIVKYFRFFFSCKTATPGKKPKFIQIWWEFVFSRKSKQTTASLCNAQLFTKRIDNLIKRNEGFCYHSEKVKLCSLSLHDWRLWGHLDLLDIFQRSLLITMLMLSFISIMVSLVPSIASVKLNLPVQKLSPKNLIM